MQTFKSAMKSETEVKPLDIKPDIKSTLSRYFWDKIFGFFQLFDEVRAELVRDISRSHRFLGFIFLTYSRKKELLFWLSRGLNQLTCVTRQIRGDSKLRD